MYKKLFVIGLLFASVPAVYGSKDQYVKGALKPSTGYQNIAFDRDDFFPSLENSSQGLVGQVPAVYGSKNQYVKGALKPATSNRNLALDKDDFPDPRKGSNHSLDAAAPGVVAITQQQLKSTQTAQGGYPLGEQIPVEGGPGTYPGSFSRNQSVQSRNAPSAQCCSIS